MDLEFDPEARDEIGELDKEHRNYVLEKLRELKERPTDHENSDVIMIKGRQIFRYVMKQGKKGGKDYRAAYDIRNGKVKILAVFHRDKGYDKEEISERI